LRTIQLNAHDKCSRRQVNKVMSEGILNLRSRNNLLNQRANGNIQEPPPPPQPPPPPPQPIARVSMLTPRPHIDFSRTYRRRRRIPRRHHRTPPSRRSLRRHRQCHNPKMTMVSKPPWRVRNTDKGNMRLTPGPPQAPAATPPPQLPAAQAAQPPAPQAATYPGAQP